MNEKLPCEQASERLASLLYSNKIPDLTQFEDENIWREVNENAIPEHDRTTTKGNDSVKREV